MSETIMCMICEADFRVNAMVGDKCHLCHSKYPNAKTKEDVKVKFKNKAETLTEKRVKDLIYETFEEVGFSRSTCEKCSSSFYRRSPAQKVCNNCKKETKK